MTGMLMLLPLILGVTGGLSVGLIPWKSRRPMQLFAAAVLAAQLAFTLWICLTPQQNLTLPLGAVTQGLEIFFRADTVGKLFSLLFSFVWLLVGVAGFEYMEHERRAPVFRAVSGGGRRAQRRLLRGQFFLLLHPL